MKKNQMKKNQIKNTIENLIAKLIYYIITGAVATATIVLLFATLGAVVELCTTNKVVCISFIVVCGYILIKQIIAEINKQ